MNHSRFAASRASSPGFLVSMAMALFAAPVLGAACSRVVINGNLNLSDYEHRASRTETKKLELKTSETFSVNIRGGKLNIRVCKGSETPSLNATITTFGETSEEAAKNLELAKFIVERGENGIEVRLDAGEVVIQKPGIYSRMFPTADIEAIIPQSCLLKLSTGAGSINAEGPFAECDVDSKYGVIQLSNASGSVKARSSSGNIQISKVKLAETLDAHSSYGHITIRDAQTKTLQVNSSSGNMMIENTEAESQKVKTSYGNIQILRVTGALSLQSSSGNITIDDAEPGSIDAETGYGNINIKKTGGKCRAKTSSGNVQISHFEGAVDARSSYGRVHTDGILTALQAASSSGEVKATIRPGSVMQQNWSLTSGYGNITIKLPDDFAADVDAKTSYGSVDCDFQELMAGFTKKDRALRGILNSDSAPSGGVHTLTLKTSSGRVSIQKIAD
ncbi:MAG: DUF4097 family beta strand repeat-containing protein [Planctomycetota bacterium]